MIKIRLNTVLGLGVLGVGLLLTAIGALFAFMSATATTLHPDADGVPSEWLAAPSPDWASAVERSQQIVRAALTEQNLPGASVAVGVGGEIVWAEGFGWADLELREPVGPHTRFRIGTASMALTSAGTGLLLEQGLLNLDEEIQRYVPEFPEKEWPVTLRQTMGHLGGLRQDAGDEEPVRVHCDQTAQVLERFASRPLLSEPGTQYRFSTYGWILVSAAIEAASGDPFFRFMRRQVFEPLGMHDTSGDASTEATPGQATYYFPRFAGDPRYGPQGPGREDFSCFAGASAFVSTPADLARFAMAIGTGQLLQPATVQLLQTSQQMASGQETGYGLGWDLETVGLASSPTRLVGHDGDLRGGMVSSFWTFPGGVVVAVTANIAFADTWSIAWQIAQAFAARPGS